MYIFNKGQQFFLIRIKFEFNLKCQNSNVRAFINLRASIHRPENRIQVGGLSTS